MEERATKRRLPGHVSDEMDGRGIDRLILSNCDRLAFPAGQDCLERHMAFEHAVAACVDVARGRANLRVGVGGEVLEDEVDEPAFALQQRKHLNCSIRGIRSDRLSRRRLVVNVRLERNGQATFEEDGEKRRERQLDPSPDSHRHAPIVDCDTGRHAKLLRRNAVGSPDERA
jgi:hypothetical protein